MLHSHLPYVRHEHSIGVPPRGEMHQRLRESARPMSAARARQVVVHVSDEPADLDRAVAAAQSLREAFPDAQVRVIVNGAALDGLQNGPALAGVEACAVGLHRRGIDPTALRGGVEVIPSAAIALTQAQFDGAAYIRV